MATALREIEVTFTDGDTKVYTTYSYPWIYREWFVIADEDEKRIYIPFKNVESYREL